MFKQGRFSVKTAQAPRKDAKAAFLLLMLSFLVGCMAGSLIASFGGYDFVLSDFVGFNTLETAAFGYVFFYFIRFHLAALLLSSSYFGIALLPLLSALKGYALSCTAASIISCYSNNGGIMALVIVGIPALFSVSCFFIMAQDSLKYSRRLLSLVRGVSCPLVSGLYLKTMACLPFLAAGTVIEMKLVPYLVSFLI